MFLMDVKLINFRNYYNTKIKLKNGINILYGDNAQGKTNILESIFVLALTKSHKSYIDNNLINIGKEKAIVSGTLLKNNIKTKLQIELTAKNKLLKIDNNVENKVNKYISNLNIIFFYPEDLDLIKGNPITRRKYLNTQLSQLQSNYLLLLNDYNKLIRLKNNFLKNKSLNNEVEKQYYDVMNNHIISKATPIYIIRKKYIEKINIYAQQIFYDLTGLKNLNILYKSSIDCEFVKDSIMLNLKQQIKKYYSDELRLKKSLIGPHLDDIEFYLDGLNLKTHGSQGQQRAAILSMKLAEVEIFKNYNSSTPVLLLDDVFSELDKTKKNKLLKYIGNNIQTIITTTDLKSINKKTLNNSKIFKITNGKIIEEVEKNERK